MISLTAVLTSCSGINDFDIHISDSNPSVKADRPERVVTEEDRNVFIMLSLGYNDLSIDLLKNIKEMERNYLPTFRREDDVVLILNHKYENGAVPVLFRVYKNSIGEVTKDTLMVYPEGTYAATAETVRDVLEYVKENFPAKGYGMLLSSHATGWAPKDYCYSPPDRLRSERLRPLPLPPFQARFRGPLTRKSLARKMMG